MLFQCFYCCLWTSSWHLGNYLCSINQLFQLSCSSHVFSFCPSTNTFLVYKYSGDLKRFDTQDLTVCNPLSANHTKWSNTLTQFVGNFPTTCVSVFDHFVKLALKELIWKIVSSFMWDFVSLRSLQVTNVI